VNIYRLSVRRRAIPVQTGHQRINPVNSS
jgi:hypothetical protein